MASERAGERPCSLFSTNTRSKDYRHQKKKNYIKKLEILMGGKIDKVSYILKDANN